MTKAQKVNESPSGRPKASDYDTTTQELIPYANAVYRSQISTNGPFPDRLQELEYVKIAWKMACVAVGVKVDMTPDLVKMVCY